jgi:hypothetical protein
MVGYGGGGGILSLMFWGAFAFILLQVAQGVMRNREGTPSLATTAAPAQQPCSDAAQRVPPSTASHLSLAVQGLRHLLSHQPSVVAPNPPLCRRL